MHNPIQQVLQDSAILRSGLSGLTAFFLLLCTQLAAGASIAGRATNNSKNEKRTVEGLVGKFSFSNFQRIFSLTGADFPAPDVWAW